MVGEAKGAGTHMSGEVEDCGQLRGKTAAQTVSVGEDGLQVDRAACLFEGLDQPVHVGLLIERRHRELLGLLIEFRHLVREWRGENH